MTVLTAERLRELLFYEPETGLFRWRKNIKGGAKAGAGAGGKPKTNGYIYIGIDGKRYLASRLAVLYMTGKWPASLADHGDLDTTNNTWTNIRDATRSQNGANSSPRSKLGVKGVRKVGNRYAAQITIKRKNIYLGLFETKEAAAQRYAEEAAKHYGEFART